MGEVMLTRHSERVLCVELQLTAVRKGTAQDCEEPSFELRHIPDSQKGLVDVHLHCVQEECLKLKPNEP